VFSNTPLLRSLYLPKSVEVIHIHAFDGSSIQQLVIDSANQCLTVHRGFLLNKARTVAIRCLSRESMIEIPATVEIVGPDCFFDCKSLVNLLCEESSKIREIGHCALTGCLKLENVILPNTIESLEKGCFSTCCSLARFQTLGDSLIHDIQDLFVGCRALISVSVPTSVEILPECCFRGCELLSMIIFEAESRLREIKRQVVEGCRSLEHILLPKQVQLIDKDAFVGSGLRVVEMDQDNPHLRIRENLLLDCQQSSLFYPLVSMTSLVILNTVATIVASCFQNCPHIASIDGRASQLQVVQFHAFESCRNLQNVLFPRSVKTLRESCFSSCVSLYSIEFARPSNLACIYEHAFASCCCLTTLSLPSSVEYINEFAFANCQRLSRINIELPSCLHTIEKGAFQSTLIKNFIIPPSLNFIGAGAFPYVCEFDFSSQHQVLIPEWLSRLILDSNAIYDSRNLPPRRRISDYVIDFDQYREFPNSEKCLISRNVHGEVRWYEHNETRYQIAVKTYWLDPNRVIGRDHQEQFQREIEVLVSLQHPCIVSLVGYSLPIGRVGPRIAMPYVGPDSLQSVLESAEKPQWWTPAIKSIVIIGIAVGMYLIHTAGIRHQDLKPSNVLLDRTTHFPKIVDFGSSQFEAAGCTMTLCSASPRYMAPELYSEEPATQKVDVFSFGVILYEIVTGQPAFDRRWNRLQLMNFVCKGNRPPVPENCSRFLQELIELCWQQKSRQRPRFKKIVNLLRDNRFQVFTPVHSTQVQHFLNVLSEFRIQ
jgi:hypothetical protein